MSESKAMQRRLCLTARRALTAEERAAHSERLCARLLDLPELREAKTVLSYLAAPDALIREFIGGGVYEY